jgi:iron uptake system component EfeO
LKSWLSVVASAVLGIAWLDGCAGASQGSGHPQVAAGTVITISAAGCGSGWLHPHSGLQTFQLRNASAGAAEVYLINPLQGSLDPDSVSAPVFAEVEGLGPGTTSPMEVDVGSGTYAFDCELQNDGTRIGPIVRIPGDFRGTPGILSVTFNDLVGSPSDPFAPARQYRAFVSDDLTRLANEVDTLMADVRAGNLAAARPAWLSAHLSYERLGAAYGTFGAFDSEIDGRADGLAGGPHSPRFTGFYRVEYGLWHGQSAADLSGPVTQLDHDVRALRAAFPTMQLVLSDLGLRAHEILENALQFQLTGHDDYGSGTTLATTSANVDGTLELLKVLHPLLLTRYEGLPQTYAWLDRLQRLIDAARRPGGGWTPVRALQTSQREQIDAAAGQALEDLAPIAAIFEVQKQL